MYLYRKLLRAVSLWSKKNLAKQNAVRSYSIYETSDGYFTVTVNIASSGELLISDKMSRSDAVNYLCVITGSPNLINEETKKIIVDSGFIN